MDDNKAFLNSLLRRLADINYISPGEAPNIDLYMDQVTTFMDEHLSDSKRHADDKILTKTMINNYAKNDLLPPPVKKKYSKNHIYILTFIYYLKNMLSISDIQKLLNPLTDNFFDGSSDITLDDIYADICEKVHSQMPSVVRDVTRKAALANSTYTDVEDDEQKEFLQLFSLVTMLGFDVYVRKMIIESLIDDYSEKHPRKTESEKKTEQKEARKEAKKKEAKKK